MIYYLLGKDALGCADYFDSRFGFSSTAILSKAYLFLFNTICNLREVIFYSARYHEIDNILIFREKITVNVNYKYIFHFNDILVFRDGSGFILKHNGVVTTKPPPFIGICLTHIPDNLTCSFNADSDTITLIAPNKGNSD